MCRPENPLASLTITSPFQGRPSFSSWISYALGTENHDLPAYVVLRDPGGYNTSGTLLGTVQTLNNTSTRNTWVKTTFDMAAYKGQTVRVQFRATTNTTNVTNFFVDDVSLMSCQ